MVSVLNDQINAARNVYKTDTARVDTFQSVDRGPVGLVDTGHVNIFAGCGDVAYNKAKLPIQIQGLPKVDIIYAYASMGRELIDAAVAAGTKGLVVAGVGNGNFTEEALAGLRDARKKGVVIVRSTRLSSGFAMRNAEVDDDAEGFVASEEFKPPKARVILKIALLTTSSPTEVQSYFDHW